MVPITFFIIIIGIDRASQSLLPRAAPLAKPPTTRRKLS